MRPFSLLSAVCIWLSRNRLGRASGSLMDEHGTEQPWFRLARNRYLTSILMGAAHVAGVEPEDGPISFCAV
jgi:hypothetical protein